MLFQESYRSYVLDGDNIRHGLNSDLSFLPEDRKENIRRIGEVAKLFVDSGQIVSSAFISPFRKDRAIVRSMFEEQEFIEIFLNCPIHVCEDRDPSSSLCCVLRIAGVCSSSVVAGIAARDNARISHGGDRLQYSARR